MAKFFITLVVLVIGVVVLFFLGRYLITNHSFPSLGEYVASTTPNFESRRGSSLVPVVTPRGTVNAFISNTPETLSKGLSGTPSMADDQGMLFIFPVVGLYDFWMKDMNFPIDIIWLDSEKRVIGIISDLATSTYPTTFSPPAPILYVLELNSRGASNFGIATGTILVF